MSVALNRKYNNVHFTMLSKQISSNLQSMIINGFSLDAEFIMIECERELRQSANMLYEHTAQDITALYWQVMRMLQVNGLAKYNKDTQNFYVRY